MSLAQYRKLAVSVVSFGAAAVALFITTDPGLNAALVSLVGAGFGVVAVFAAKNHTPDDLSKAVAQLQGAALSVAGFFVTVPTTLPEKLAVLSAAAVSVIGVYWARNEPS